MSSINLKYIRGDIDSNQYLDLVLDDCDLSEISSNCEGLAQEIRNTITVAFWRLNDLDRSHSFWRPGNGLPTIHKLGEYSTYQIKNGVEIGFWSWVGICISYFYFSNFLDSELWSSIERPNIKWLVRTSWNYNYYSGSESSVSLASVLRSLEVESEAGIELNELSKLTKAAEGWVNEVKDCLCQP